MSDSLLLFLMTRNPDKVAAEWGPVKRDRRVSEPRRPDPALLGAWRRRALVAEERNPVPAEVMATARRVNAENKVLRKKLMESRLLVAERKAS